MPSPGTRPKHSHSHHPSPTKHLSRLSRFSPRMRQLHPPKCVFRQTPSHRFLCCGGRGKMCITHFPTSLRSFTSPSFLKVHRETQITYICWARLYKLPQANIVSILRKVKCNGRGTSNSSPPFSP